VADERAVVVRVLAHRDRLHVDDRVVALRPVRARVLAERRLGLALGRMDLALEHELRPRRDLDVDRLALHHLERLADHRACDRELVDVDAREAEAPELDRGMDAGEDRHLRRAAALDVLLHDVVPVRGLGDLDPHLVLRLDL